MTMDTAALARQLAELDKVATPGPWKWTEADELREEHQKLVGPSEAVCDFGCWTQYYPIDGTPPSVPDGAIILTLRNNLPAILRALCVMAAVEDGLGAAGTVIADKRCLLAVNARADELLAECTGAK